jgi:hypothetical protein
MRSGRFKGAMGSGCVCHLNLTLARNAPRRLTCLRRKPYNDSPGLFPCEWNAAAKGKAGLSSS